ncbi:transcriptional regulator [Salmonella enterica subsp. enterica]|uniref:Transcriptional regulator n=1 Tax=Salmonella enterica TaxID=28901 RepID=A0A747EMC8_SALER|nr:transcriptional regulator [Salmonella enterica subsp. enterica serovar Umbilo]EAA3706101.1 transcriptional regulator [Salmonella enterica subsp. enterica serovar Newport]EAA4187303.1 transcriptional regulator [Salmonella enterica subsp. enterica serovar Mikawasima]EAB9315061.1 transcriptional regulator [Salmonella enterica subsp. enterica serovar Typhimurium]EAY7465603.1 transcriptional regulator [Salmonella enterica]EBH9039588.1 transcriptional regulator [Salmonella enterica subsp. indica 
MYKSDALTFFGTKTKLAKAAGVRLSSIYKWGALVPEGRASRLQEASNGFLHYDKNLYDQYRKARRSGGAEQP